MILKFNGGCSRISNYVAHLPEEKRPLLPAVASAPCEKPEIPSNRPSAFSIIASTSKLSTNPVGGSQVSCSVCQAYASISSRSGLSLG